MTGSDLVGALRPVIQALDRLHVRHFLGGSVASSAHGVARASLDVDVVAELEADHIDRLAEALGGRYYVPAEQMRRAVAERRSFNLIHLATMFKIDVFVSKGRPFDQLAASRAQLQPIGTASDAWECRIASPEDTVLAKLEWFRLGGGVSERQWWDVMGLLKVHADADRDYLRQWAPALDVADLLERALAEAGQPAGSGG
jgi:hypothetical protein